MLSLGGIAFLNPWILAGLAALPLLWWLLRAIPPSPKLQVFAGVRLLLGLEDEERQSHKTPWWLLLIRILAIAAALLGLAKPVLNLSERIAPGDGVLLIVLDQGWASAPDWDARRVAANAILDEAEQADRDVLLWRAAEGGDLAPLSAGAARSILASLEPRPWAPDHGALSAALAEAEIDVGQVIWLHDGIRYGDATESLLADLADAAPLRLIGPEEAARALTPPRLDGPALVADVLRADQGPAETLVTAYAEAEGGGERRIAVADAAFEAGDTSATVVFDLPMELQSTVTRIVLADRPSAGGAAFADSAIRRVRAALVNAEASSAPHTLTSPLHYLENALDPWAEVANVDFAAALDDPPSTIVLVDHGAIEDPDRTRITEWVEAGGLLIRFAGPRLAASIGESSFGVSSGSVSGDDPLLPVRLRRGGRVLGGALAWSTPRSLGPFDPSGPFRGLVPPDEVDVRTQVLAEPSPDLAGKVWASLDDGTPMVTAKQLGDGYVVLFHVSADAEWSSLPLSGLFVEMLGRLVTLAPGRSAGTPDADGLAGTLWRAERLMGPDGTPEAASALAEPVPGERISEGVAGPELPPGLYLRADGNRRAAGEAEGAVINLTDGLSSIEAFPAAPLNAVSETLGGEAPVRYGPWLIAAAILLAFADVIGTLIVSGRLILPARAAAGIALALVLMPAPEAVAQVDDPVSPEALAATAETTLGFILTGDGGIDRVSERALVGLGEALSRRTAIEPGPPVGVRPGQDELAFYSVLYWPLTSETVPERGALEALSRYLSGGGMLIIDTQNGSSGFNSATGAQMREIARALNLPPLAPVDQDHVLTRTFYLLNVFPGRWRGGRVWSEAPPPAHDGSGGAADIPAFDRVDDNVSPVIVGSADWASAWAVDERGYPLFPIGRPGDRQREMAIRFGVNAVMYALTGNYKSDQVHAPAVLQRLGQ